MSYRNFNEAQLSLLQSEVVSLLHNSQHLLFLHQVFAQFAASSSTVSLFLSSTGALQLFQQTVICPDAISGTEVLYLYEEHVQQDLVGLTFEDFLKFLAAICIKLVTVDCRYAAKEYEYTPESLVKFLIGQLSLLESQYKGKNRLSSSLIDAKPSSQTKFLYRPSASKNNTQVKEAWSQGATTNDVPNLAENISSEFNVAKSEVTHSQMDQIQQTNSHIHIQIHEAGTNFITAKHSNETTPENPSISCSNSYSESSIGSTFPTKLSVDKFQSGISMDSCEGFMNSHSTPESELMSASKCTSTSSSSSTTLSNKEKKGYSKEENLQLFLVRNAIKEQMKRKRLQESRKAILAKSIEKKEFIHQQEYSSNLHKSRIVYFENNKEKFDNIKNNDQETGQRFFKPTINERKVKKRHHLYKRAVEKQRREAATLKNVELELQHERNKSRLCKGSVKFVHNQIFQTILRLFEKRSESELQTELDSMTRHSFSLLLQEIGYLKEDTVEILSCLLDPEETGYISSDMFKILIKEAISKTTGTAFSKNSDKYHNHIQLFGNQIRKYYMDNRDHEATAKKVHYKETLFSPTICPRSRKLDRLRQKKIKDSSTLPDEPRSHAIYRRASLYNKKHQELKNREEIKEMKECSFKPNLADSKKKLKEFLPPRKLLRSRSESQSNGSHTRNSVETEQKVSELASAPLESNKSRTTYSVPVAKDSDLRTYPKSYFQSVQRVRNAKADQLKSAKNNKGTKDTHISRDPITGHLLAQPFKFSLSREDRKKERKNFADASSVRDDSYETAIEENYVEEEKDSDNGNKELLFVLNITFPEVPRIKNNRNSEVMRTEQIPVYVDDRPRRLATRFAALNDINSESEDEIEEILTSLKKKFEAKNAMVKRALQGGVPHVQASICAR